MAEELTEQQQEELKQRLTKLKQELEQQLQQAEQSTTIVQLDQQAIGRVCRQDALLQQSMAKATATQARKRLQQVVRALQACAESEYGYCLQCDEGIGFARLSVRPETPLCLACQSAAEQSG